MLAFVHMTVLHLAAQACFQRVWTQVTLPTEFTAVALTPGSINLSMALRETESCVVRPQIVQIYVFQTQLAKVYPNTTGHYNMISGVFVGVLVILMVCFLASSLRLASYYVRLPV